MNLQDLYSLALAHATWVLVAGVAFPVVGTLAAWIGRGGRTDRDGRAIADLVVAVGALVFALEVIALLLVQATSERGLAWVLEADLRLLLAPLVCGAGSVLGVRLVFPLSTLASGRTLADLGAFLVACLAAWWLLSRFRGWGVLFLGNMTQLVVFLALGALLLARLWRRARRGREVGP